MYNADPNEYDGRAILGKLYYFILSAPTFNLFINFWSLSNSFLIQKLEFLNYNINVLNIIDFSIC